MITHTMVFTNSNLSLVDGRPPKKEGKFADVAQDLEKLGYIIQSKQSEANTIEVVFVKPETTIDELQIALHQHDWTYTYSDSPWSQKSGIAQVNTIRALVQKIGDEGFQMVSQHIEEHYPNGGTHSPEFYRSK